MNATLHYPWLVYDILPVGLSWDSMDGISAVIKTSCKHTQFIGYSEKYVYLLPRVQHWGRIPQATTPLTCCSRIHLKTM